MVQKLQKQHALKGQKLLAQGSALGITAANLSPCKGKSFKIPTIYKAFALTGRLADCHCTQGDALGIELLPFQGVWGKTCET